MVSNVDDNEDSKDDGNSGIIKAYLMILDYV